MTTVPSGCTCVDPAVACASCVAKRDRNGWPKDWQERMRRPEDETDQSCDHDWEVVWDGGGIYSATDCCRHCGAYRTGWGCPAVYGEHEWLDRPESDTRECLICGTEVAG